MEEEAKDALKALIRDAVQEAENNSKIRYKAPLWALIVIAIETGALLAILLIATDILPTPQAHQQVVEEQEHKPR